MVGSLALAHDRSCEAEFAETIGAERMPADRLISRRSADASRRIQPPFPTSSVGRRHRNFMTSSAQPGWSVWHENDIPALGLALHRIAVRRGQGRAELGIARLGKARHGRRIGQACRGTASHCLSSRGKASIESPACLSAALFGRQATALRGRRGIAWQGWAWHGAAVRAAAKPEAGAG